DRQSGWVSLTPTEGTTLASIIASDSQGRIDAWLVSPTIQDFANPDSFEYWYFDSNFNIIFETIVFTATLELEAVPEPTSAIAVSGLTFGFLALRRARARRFLWRQTHA
ncbi:MAG: PEP-CTERM sorting domain-containing protein, partial [Planctomycetes bacterium]|nr:PEP-CTERM sorting domain-containing protein [Planctomycetota bacterium]